jgi:hypothetical protein
MHMPTILRTTERARRAGRANALALVLVAAGGAMLTACGDETTAAPSAARAGYDDPGTHRQYGTPIALGHGKARTYVVLKGGVPLETGIAFDEDAMQGLPSTGSGHHEGPAQNGPVHEFYLPMPAQNPTPYKTIMLNWNPNGHELPGIYDVPHFDFHFYMITPDEVRAIDPQAIGMQEYMAKSANLPTGALVPPFHVALAAPGSPVVAVPQMGVHWPDMRAAELQAILGNPGAYRPFAATFIYGSWDGKFVFNEPMITRAHILSKKAATSAAERDEVIPISTAVDQAVPGYYPSAYRITFDAQAKEYRVAMAQLSWRN